MEHIWKVIDLSRTVGDNVVTKINFQLRSSTVDPDPIFSDRKVGEVLMALLMESRMFLYLRK